MTADVVSPSETRDRIASFGLIAILRTNYEPAQLVEIGHALVQGGMRIVEVTLNSPNSLEGIRVLREALAGSALVGAGTVRNEADVDSAVDAGAQFLIAPNVSGSALERARSRERLMVPGVLTPTEVQCAVDHGCDMVKLFPAEPLGPRYLAAIRGPLNDVAFVPTGGITVDNLGDHVAAGATAFGLGSALVGDAPLTSSELDRIRVTAGNFARRLQAARDAFTSIS